MKQKSVRSAGKGFTLVELMVVIGIIAVLAGLVFPTLAETKLTATIAADMVNVKGIGTSCLSFAQDYGVFPLGVKGGAPVTESESSGPSINSSNEAFRTLFFTRALNADAEKLFYINASPFKKPDGEIGDNGNEYRDALDKGECGYAYFAGYGSSDQGPLAWTPTSDAISYDQDKGWTSQKTVSAIYQGKAINVVYTDGHAVTLRYAGEQTKMVLGGVGTEDLPIKAVQPEKK